MRAQTASFEPQDSDVSEASGTSWLYELIHSFCCCCVPKSNYLQLKTLPNRQTFQKIFLSCIPHCHSLSTLWMSSLHLGPWCLLLSAPCLEIFDPCKLCTCSACFFPFWSVSPVLVKGDTTPNRIPP